MIKKDYNKVPSSKPDDEREKEIWSNFINTLKSDATKGGYTRGLVVYRKFCKVSTLGELVDIPIEKIKNDIKSYFISLNEGGLSTSFIKYMKAIIKHLYDMNDIENLGWKILSMFIGEETEVFEDRAYTHKEIETMLLHADYRLKVCICFEKSAGFRVGALNTIKLGHLIKKEDCYKIDAYRGRKGKGKYYGFCDAETVTAIENYKEFRIRCGEIIDDNSPLLRDEFDTEDPSKAKVVKAISRDTIRNDMSRHLVLCGLRTVEHGKIRGNRKEVKMTHGFRKFFRTQLALAKVEYEVRKALVGHSTKDLDLVYTKYTEDQLFAEYKKAIPFLRIDQTVKLKKKVEEQQVQLNEVELLKIKYNHDMTLLLESNKEEKKSMEERLDKIQQENKEREERLISLIVKESLVGKPVIPKENLDLIFRGDLNAIPLSVSNREGEDIKDFIINKDIESIKNNYEEESKKLKKPITTKGKSKLIVMEDPPEGF